MGRQQRVAVVGSAHLDVVGDYKESGILDKPGSVSFSTGGSGYNVAIGLAGLRCDVRFLTFLKEGSLISPLVLSQLKVNRIKPFRIKSLERGQNKASEAPPPSGFVAHRGPSGEISAAVTSTTIDRLLFLEGSKEWQLLRKALSGAKAVFVDANLSPVGLLAVIAEARSLPDRRVIVGAVSERKIRNIRDIVDPSLRTDVVCASELEVASLDSEFEPETGADRSEAARVFLGQRLQKQEYVQTLLTTLRTRAVALTRRGDGVRIYLESGESLDLRLPTVDGIKSRTGVGDAIAAAITVHLSTPGCSISGAEVSSMQNLIDASVSPVLREIGATRGSNLDLDEEEQKRASSFLGQAINRVRDFVVGVAISKAAAGVFTAILLLVVGMAFGTGAWIYTWLQGLLKPH